MSVPKPCDKPQKLIANPRRSGFTKSLTTEKPTNAMAPRPRAVTICHVKSCQYT